MDDWQPKPNAALALTGLTLDPEQGFLLSRIDGHTSVEQLVHLTGMPVDRVLRILGVLVQAGAISQEEVPPALTAGFDALVLLNTLDEQFPIDDLEGDATSIDGAPLLDDDTDPSGDESIAGRDESSASESESESESETSAKTAGFESSTGTFEADLPFAEDGASENWNQLYQSHWRALPQDERVEAVRRASGDVLHAFCFDQNARVLRAILENSQAGLSHARLLAQHHVNGAGLDLLGQNAHFLRDAQVQRALMRNAQLTEALLKRILQPKALSEVYRICASRDVTERVRNQARRAFRTKFAGAAAEEKINLIVQCEGRCLSALVGVALDGKSAALLAQRSIQSTLLVQNLVRWPSTPPPVLLHLAKQPIVLRSPPLKNLVLRHPNTSAQVKKQLG